jgi:hypothetical protein
MSGEMRMVRDALFLGALAAPVAAAAAYLARGLDGALSAFVALGIVLGNAALSAAASAIAGRRSASTAAAVALPSFAFRMLGIFVAMALLARAPFVDRPTFALTFGVAVAVVIALEARTWKRTPWIALSLKE